VVAENPDVMIHSTSEGEPETSRPRPRPVHLSPSTPVGRRISGEGAALRTPPQTVTPVRADHAADRSGKVQRLLRHRLTSPEKRTVKRIQAQRAEYFEPLGERPSLDLVRAKVLQMLRDDRGLQQGGLNADAYELLAGWLVDDALSGRPAAEIVGLFLREVGAMERPELSAPRVKSALRALNEVLYGDAQDGPIPLGVREFRLEKRDGGLQIVGILRNGADEARVRAACQRALVDANLRDVDVRLVSRQVPSPR
jgi:hypothetical protein